VSTTPGDSALFTSAADPIQIAGCSPSSPDASRLLRALHDEQVDRYGFADPSELSAPAYMPPRGMFVVARQGTTPIGCVGYRWFHHAEHTVEMKRLYVVPASRGQGAGRVLLAWLEHHAITAGAHRAILETGVHNTAAIELITSVGYRPVDRYVDGRDPKINRAYGRSLTGRP
jgi:GNAT superfamily N-acetyltransferase